MSDVKEQTKSNQVECRFFLKNRKKKEKKKTNRNNFIRMDFGEYFLNLFWKYIQYMHKHTYFKTIQNIFNKFIFILCIHYYGFILFYSILLYLDFKSIWYAWMQNANMNMYYYSSGLMSCHVMSYIHMYIEEEKMFESNLIKNLIIRLLDKEATFPKNNSLNCCQCHLC